MKKGARTMKTAKALTLAQVREHLADLARIGQAFIDGDLCHTIYRPIGNVFKNSDDIDFNPEAGVPLKQTLMKLERLAKVPCVVVLWRRRPDMPKVGEPTLNGSFGSCMLTWRTPMSGARVKFSPPPMFPQLAAAFKGKTVFMESPKPGASGLIYRGFCVNVRGIRKPTYIQAFAPIKDSMGEISAVLEVFIAAGG